MISQSIQAFALLLSLSLKAQGFPFEVYRVIKASRPLGFDPDYQSDHVGEVPQLQVLSDSDLALNVSAPRAEPSNLDDADDDDGEEDNALQKRFINGNDNRFLFTKNTYPFNTVGKLQWSNGVFCSGALVGPRHLLTAKHCIETNASGTFSPSFDESARDGSAQIQKIFTSNQTWGTPCGWKGDWAIMILSQRLGDRLGYMGVRLPEPKRVSQPIFRHMGYPGDKDDGMRPYRTNGNAIEEWRSNFDCDRTGPFYTDTDAAGGQSGGPLWENLLGRKRYVWGTLSVTFDGGDGVAWAGWGSGNEMVNAVIKARIEYP